MKNNSIVAIEISRSPKSKYNFYFMSEPQWRFRPYGKDEMRTNPIQEEFFTTNIVRSISNAMVREGIQNALDEWTRVEGTTVKVRLFLSGQKYSIAKEEFDSLLNGLYPHLEEPSSGLRSMPDLNEGMRYLVFEDFNTNGLEGDPEEADGEDHSKSHNFYWFWRNIGISGKSDDKLGRWGLGKTVFPAASRANIFWGVTVRKSDNRKLLLGQAILMSHKFGSDPKYGYVPYGYYGLYNDPTSYFSSPVEDNSIIERFEKLFRMNRKKNTGLSIIVPFVSDGITLSKLTYSAIEQYFYPILQGTLEVRLEYEDEVVELSKATIRKVVSELDFAKLSEDENLVVKSKESFERLFSLADWVSTIQEADFVSLKQPEISNVPQWRQYLFETLDLKALSQVFENGERIAFRVPLKFHPKGQEGSIRWYKAILERDPLLAGPENHFIRNGITITGIRSLQSPGVRGLVLIEDESLVKMIGDAENPAHTEIQNDSRNFKNKYENGDKCLTFLTRTLQELFLKLQKPAEGIEKDALKDVFFVPLSMNEQEQALPDDNSGTDISREKNPTIATRTISFVEIQKTSDGFRILRNPSVTGIIGANFEVRVGYRIGRGNAITRYDKLDFELDKPPIKTLSKAVVIKTQHSNELQFEIQDDEFELTLAGFDHNRDLVIKLDKVD